MPLAPGDAAPNFDLTSTEDVVLMLADEVVRTAIVLYVCPAPLGERTRRELTALAAASPSLVAVSARVLVVSPAPLEELKTVQRELELPFPLLHDDRNFALRYGVGGADAPPALLLVDRRQRVAWTAAGGLVEESLPALTAALDALPSPAEGLPRKVVNRLIDQWVN
ncbi:MAG: redoxin domain-containing protein [Thermoanaerobaculia bacterium]